MYGAGTFVLGLHRNTDNLRIAQKENSVIFLEENYQSNYGGFDPNNPESVISLVLMQETYLEQSIEAANTIQKSFVTNLNRKDRTVKQAGFQVLRETYMPSVLVELGFLTNKKEGAYLNSKKGQKEMSETIAKGIINYRNKLISSVFKKEKQIAELEQNKKNETNNKRNTGIVFKIQILASSKSKAIRKANFKSLLYILLSLNTLGQIACSDLSKNKAEGLEEATALREAGNGGSALELLEGLAEEYPNDPQILRQIGEIYKTAGDHTTAAFFLEQAHHYLPNDVELLYETYQEVIAAGQPAGTLLEKLAELSADSMNSDLWIALGDHYAEHNKTSSALDAYVKGVNSLASEPSAEVAATIGQLFVQLDNLTQAERWFVKAADNDSPEALTALFGLLDVKRSQKDWGGAQAVITRVDHQFPGAINASEFASVRAELESWREAREAMKDELAKVVTATKTDVNKSNLDPGNTANENASKASTLADIEAAESLANTPAVESFEETVPELAETDQESAIKNPDIAIESTDTEMPVDVEVDQEATSDTVSFSTGNSLADVTIEGETAEPLDLEPVVSLRNTLTPRSIDELLDEATKATIDKNYRLVISNYWQVLGIADDRDDVWNLLSRIYMMDGQFNNAETTALEAIRLSPRDANYTLDYLRAAQRSKQPEEFLADLSTAYERFPQSPEITLALARGYERIAKNNPAARTLYQRFIELAPSHPLIPEAEAAVARLL